MSSFVEATTCSRRAFLALPSLLSVCVLAGCAKDGGENLGSSGASGSSGSALFSAGSMPIVEDAAKDTWAELDAAVDETRAALNLTEDWRASFVHGDKPASYQKYIVMHDTEGTGDASGVINWWDNNGKLIAAHFVVNMDGSIWQCVPLDKIAHHAGFGDAGHNELYGISEDGRDDMLGTTPIGDWAPDYGMNAWSIGIEMVHVGGSGDYPEAQLAGVDALIAYLDAYYAAQGLENAGSIIDHKAWRTGNSDTSAEFASYLSNLQDHRTTR